MSAVFTWLFSLARFNVSPTERVAESPTLNPLSHKLVRNCDALAATPTGTCALLPGRSRRTDVPSLPGFICSRP